MRKLLSISISATLLAITAGAPLIAHAARRVYLRSGANLVCDHDRNVNGDVRLYMTPSEDSYLEVDPADILREESAPTPSVPRQAGPDTSAEISRAVQVKPPAPVAVPLDLDGLLHRAGAQHHIDPDLLASVVRAESGGNIRAVSRTGAQGLMQLMPATASDLRVRDIHAPDQNVAGGATYLDALLMYYHDDVIKALAAYNAGPAAVDRYHGIPPYAETRRYVARVIHEYNRRKALEARQASRATAAMAEIP